MHVKTALSIAGSDSSGGAGIQADIKTMTMHGVYAMTAITALTAQNTTGVRAVTEVTPEFLRQQIDAVFEDIRPDSVKIGMIPNGELAEIIVEQLQLYHAEHIVVDPVMIATSGARLSQTSTLRVLREQLLPLAEVATPNLQEAETLWESTIRGQDTMERAAKGIAQACKCAVLLKGGHCLDRADDLLYADGTFTWFPGERIQNPNTHGTGCTLSSAIAANLAKGFPLIPAIRMAKAYLTNALASMLDLGHGSGPLNHAFALQMHTSQEGEENNGTDL